MRIGVFIEPWINQQAGISVFTRELARAALKGKHQYVQIGSKPMVEGLEFLRVPAWKSSFYNPLRYLNVLRIDLRDYDIQYLVDPTHYSTLGLFKGAPRMTILHDLTALKLSHMHRIQSVLAHKLLLPRAMRDASHVVAVSNQTKADLLGMMNIDPNRIYTVHPGIQFQPDSGVVFSDNRQTGYILAVGTIEPRKNHKNLIRAFEVFSMNCDSIQLKIVGAVGWKVNIYQLIENSSANDRIDYLGYVSKDELEQLYRRAMFSVYASYYEGFGLPILESMALGCPVVTSDRGAMKEAAGDAALFFDPECHQSMAKAMAEMYSNHDLRNSKIEQGLVRANEFSWSRFIESMEQIFERE